MIHELQTSALVLLILATLAGIMYGEIFLARQVDWRVVPEQFWRHPFYAPTLLFLILFPLRLAWVAVGLTIEGFGMSHFTQGHFYNSTLNGMEYMYGRSRLLMVILFLGEQGYIHGLKPLLQRVKAAIKS